MKFYHYHKYDDKGRPIISVCIIKDITAAERVIYSRGMAICSLLDYGCLKNKRGKMIARSRALTAATTKVSRGNINEYGGRKSVIDQFHKADAVQLLYASYKRKVGYNIPLTPEEVTLIQEVDGAAAMRAAKRREDTVIQYDYASA